MKWPYALFYDTFFPGRILLGMLGLYCFSMLLTPPFIGPKDPSPSDFLVFNLIFFGLNALLLIASYTSATVKKRFEVILFAVSSLFVTYVNFRLFLTGYDDSLSRFTWIFLAISGSCFNKKRFILSLFFYAYLGSVTIQYLSPPGAFPFSVWSFMLLTPPIILVYFLVVSRSLMHKLQLEAREIQLRRTTEELDKILNTLNVMIAFKDENNVYKKVNKAMAAFLGTTRDDLEGKSLYDIVPFDLAKRSHDEDLLILKAGKPSLNRIEQFPSPVTGYPVWLRSNKIAYIDEHGKTAGVVFSSEDVTEQVLAERKLRESEERFRMIFENAPDGMVLIEYPQWKFIKVNRAFVEMLGFEERDILKMDPLDLTHPDDRQDSRKLYTKIVENETFFAHEVRFTHKNNQTVHCMLSIYVVKAEEKPKYIIVSVKDITLKKENEVRLRRYARQLEESNQNLQEFAYAASHDLREPLRTVVSYVQLLKKKLPAQDLNQDTTDFMEYVIGGAKRMETQILALLDYSRVGKGDLKAAEFDLKDAVEAVCFSLRKQMNESKATVEMSCLPTIVADRSQIEALLQNLISNAIKYKNPDRPPHIRIHAIQLKNEWQVSVSDNGIGIEEEFLEKIFAVFRRLHNQHQIPGTGVGLAICRRIAQRHGGNIWATSRPGQGSTFHFTLSVLSEYGQLPALELPMKDSVQ